MTRDVLLELLNRKPFEQLTLTLSNNEQTLVYSPDGVQVGRNFVVIPASAERLPGTEKTTITLHHIISVQSEAAPQVEEK